MKVKKWAWDIWDMNSGSWVSTGGLEGEWALALSGYSLVTPQTPSLIDRGLASWGLGQWVSFLLLL